MPAETPAAVTILPRSTTRSSTGIGAELCEVAHGAPVGGGVHALQHAGRRRARASRCTPTWSTGSWDGLGAPSRAAAGRSSWRACRGRRAPPGRRRWTRRRRRRPRRRPVPDVGAERPRCLAATKTISAPGRRESTSYGPMASRAVKRSKRAMAIFMRCPFPVRAPGNDADRLRDSPGAIVETRGTWCGTLPKPTAAATSSSPSVVLSSSRRAASRRAALDVRGRRAAGLALEHTCEVAGAHRAAGGEGGHRQVRGRDGRPPTPGGRAAGCAPPPARRAAR